MARYNFISRSLDEQAYEVVMFPAVEIPVESLRDMLRCDPAVDPRLVEDTRFQIGYAGMDEIMTMRRYTNMQMAKCQSPAHAIAYIQGHAEADWFDRNELFRDVAFFVPEILEVAV